MVKYAKMLKPISLNVYDGLDVNIYNATGDFSGHCCLAEFCQPNSLNIYIYIYLYLYIYIVSVAWHHCVHPL